MTVPLWALLGFAVWTVVLLLSTVGVYRWSRILTGRVQIQEFCGDQIEGELVDAITQAYKEVPAA